MNETSRSSVTDINRMFNFPSVYFSKVDNKVHTAFWLQQNKWTEVYLVRTLGVDFRTVTVTIIHQHHCVVPVNSSVQKSLKGLTMPLRPEGWEKVVEYK